MKQDAGRALCSTQTTEGACQNRDAAGVLAISAGHVLNKTMRKHRCAAQQCSRTGSTLCSLRVFRERIHRIVCSPGVLALDGGRVGAFYIRCDKMARTKQTAKKSSGLPRKNTGGKGIAKKGVKKLSSGETVLLADASSYIVTVTESSSRGALCSRS